MLVGIRIYNKQAISCTADSIPAQIMNKYCWIQGTFIVTTHINETGGGRTTLFPYEEGTHSIRYQSYYPYVSIALFIRKLIFLSLFCFILPVRIVLVWMSSFYKQWSIEIKLSTLFSHFRRIFISFEIMLDLFPGWRIEFWQKSGTCPDFNLKKARQVEICRIFYNF